MSDSSIDNEKGTAAVAAVEIQERKRHVLNKATRVSAVMSVIFAGIALCSDGYNASIVGYINPILKEVYGADYSKDLKTRVSNAFFIGEIFGMLFLGYLVDKAGRKAGVVLTTCILILGIALSAASHGQSNTGLIWMLIVSRGIAGFGAGGEYSTSGSSATEAADETDYVRKKRGFLIAMVGDFAIDFGFVLGGLVTLIVLAAYGSTGDTLFHPDGIWRVCLGVGLVAPLAVFYFRYKMINSTAYRNNAMKRRVPYWLVVKRYWPRIIGTCACWFLYDFVSYPFGIFSTTIVSQLGPENTLVQNIGYGTLINAFYLPGCVVGGLLLDKIGRRNTQMLGFALTGVFGMILGGALGPIETVFPLFVVLYGIFVSLLEMGPGVATILISSEVYPTAVRGQLLGFSAAWGKAGAAIGTQVFTPIQDAFPDVFKGTQAVFLIGSGVSILGALVTYFLIPEMNRDLGDEDEKFRQYLLENGYDVEQLGEPLEASAPTAVIEEVKAVEGAAM